MPSRPKPGFLAPSAHQRAAREWGPFPEVLPCVAKANGVLHQWPAKPILATLLFYPGLGPAWSWAGLLPPGRVRYVEILEISSLLRCCWHIVASRIGIDITNTLLYSEFFCVFHIRWFLLSHNTFHNGSLVRLLIFCSLKCMKVIYIYIWWPD